MSGQNAELSGQILTLPVIMTFDVLPFEIRVLPLEKGVLPFEKVVLEHSAVFYIW
jgi:hypothetical protein